MNAKKHKILVVGQTPPPFCGQSIMIEEMLAQDYARIEFIHVRMAFSDEIDEIGKFKITKIWHLLSLITKIVFTKSSSGAKVLYYPPAGPNRMPIYRDFAILICTRWLFRQTVFHFHAGGLSTIYPLLTRLERFLFRKAYTKPDGAILLSKLNPRDDEFLQARHKFVIPNGIKDHFQLKRLEKMRLENSILFVGLITESKGVLLIIEAISLLKKRNIRVNAKFMGQFKSAQFEASVISKIEKDKIEDRIKFLGVLTGDKKWQQFYSSNIFCFPSFYESEALSLVVIEAMQFKLPTIVSNWRGLPSLVTDGKTGFIVENHNPIAIADKIELLISNPELVNKMGENGRNKYLANYSIITFRDQMERAFVRVAES